MRQATLEYRERSAAAGGGAGTRTVTVVLLHGFGADADDLAPLADLFDPQREYRWLFPQAPYRVTLFGPSSRAWFPRTEAEIAAAATGVYFQRLRERDPETLRDAGREVAAFCRELDLAPEKTVLGGFSQGAVVALEATLADGFSPFSPAALTVLSGALIAERRWREQLPNAVAGVPVLQSHGSADEILTLSEATALSELLIEGGARVEFHRFEGGHSIPSELAGPFGRLLQEVRSGRNGE